MAAIKKHNSDPNATYQQEANNAADMTDEERDKRRGYKPPSKNVKMNALPNKVKGNPPSSLTYVR